MKILGLHWVIHLSYLAAFVSLVLLGQNYLRQATYLQQELRQVQAAAYSGMYKHEREVFYKLQHQTDPCQTKFNQELMQKISWARVQVDSFTEKCGTLGQQLENQIQAQPEQWASGIANDYWRISQSLENLENSTDSSGSAASAAMQAWTAESLTDLLSAADRISASQLVNNLGFKASATLSEAILLAVEKTDQCPVLKFDHILPVFSIDNSENNPNGGTAEVFYRSYTNWPMHVLVDHKTLEVDQGVAHFQTVFQHRGTYKIPVSITIKNPVTEKEVTYEKVFSIPVFPN